MILSCSFPEKSSLSQAEALALQVRALGMVRMFIILHGCMSLPLNCSITRKLSVIWHIRYMPNHAEFLQLELLRAVSSFDLCSWRYLPHAWFFQHLCSSERPPLIVVYRKNRSYKHIRTLPYRTASIVCWIDSYQHDWC